jgi:enediyne biosynthesis protein E4
MKEQSGPGFVPEMVSRGLAAADIDNDGDLDLLVTNNNGPPNLLLNEGGSGNSVIVRAVGTTGNRSAIGTRLVLTTGQRRQIRDVQSGSSYLAQNDLRAHFGLGQSTQSERLEIRWPGGMTEIVENLPANHVITIREGKGIVSRVPFTR